MKDPEITIGQLTLPMSKWCTQFRQKPNEVQARYAKTNLPSHHVVFGVPKMRDGKRHYLQVGNVRMTCGRWARLTCQSQTALAKKVERGVPPLEAIFGSSSN
ncbi:hypothetical protein [Planctomycetes bacterium TBK1r]|uniref:Uncharacterized protein n=1 Tax=Stieleria magnilauensis TaxID=2527963 RepID=A0ABX5XI51_9BACT|nr:hypothetical protein TBK1r_05820 [Planctomycetes bacterium TBK1r]